MQKYYGWWLPADFSTTGAGIDRLIVIIHIFMAVLFVGWFIFLVYLIVRFRDRPGHKAHYHTEHFKVPTYLEVGVAVFEMFLLAAFSYPVWHRTHNEFPTRDQALQVKVVAEQFAWNVHYAGKDGVFGRVDAKLMNSTNPIGLDPDDPAGKDDITTINQLHIPVGKPVIVDLTSKDVIHSFFLPVMRVKQDVIPGQSIPVWFQATGAGDFEIACAQLCGLGHYRMKGFFTIDTPEKFAAWMEEQAALKNPPPAEPAVAAQETHTP